MLTNTPTATGRAWTGGRNSEYFPDPFCDVASLSMPQTIQDALRWCFVPGTPIELAGLSIRSIEDVQPGMQVLTRGGTHERVVACSVREVDCDLVHVAFDGLGKRLPWRVTANHKVQRLRGDGKRHSKTQVVFDMSLAEEITVDQLQVGDYVGTPLPVALPDQPPRFSGWLLGMYLAEGCPIENGRGHRGVRFTLGADDEVVGVTAKLVELLYRQLGLAVEVYTPNDRPDIRLVTVWDYEFADWCVAHGGELATTKQLSQRVLAYGGSFLAELLVGFSDGDGWIKHSDNRFGGLGLTTSSRSLAFQFQRIAAVAGIRASLAEVSNHRGFGRADGLAYQLLLLRDDITAWLGHSVKYQASGCTLDRRQGSKSGTVIRDGYVYRRVVAVSREHYRGPVHNFEVEHDHSYVAGGVCASNCEYILMANGPYREAINRVISYFITDIEIVSAAGDDKLGREERQKYLDFLNDTLGIRTILHTVALDYMGYGNSFTSLLVPFRRYLSCKGCGFELPLKRVVNASEFNFTWSGFEFHATCPHCHYSGLWRHIDRRGGEQEQIKIKRWSPHEIDILHDPYTEDKAYIWKIPDDYRQLLRKGHLHHLERASWEIVQAVKDNKHLLFDRDVIYHMFENPMAGLRARGWGVSRVLTNFRQAWYVQVLHRYNEAIALDYVIPFRVITPMPRPGQGGGETSDPVLSINLGSFTARVNGMLRARRRDPARWNVLPFPLQYQALGGDATQLAPKDLLELGMDMLLNACGVPVELYKGNLQAQAAPAALRLFEANWSHLVHNLNRFLNKLVEKVSQIMSWEPVTCRLVRVTHADDLNRQMAKLQLMMGGQISKSTGLSSVGLEFLEEERRKFEEERVSAEEGQKQQKEMEQAAQMDELAQGAAQGAPPGAAPPGAAPPGAAPPGAAPPPPGQMPAGPQPGMAAGPQPPGAMGVPPGPGGAAQQFGAQQGTQPTDTPEALQAKAQTMAAQIMSMPESQKDSALIQLKRNDPTLHALVRSIIEQTKQQAQTQGGAMLMQQQYGGGGGGGAPPGGAMPAGDPGAGAPKQAAFNEAASLLEQFRYGKPLRTIQL